MRLQSYLTWITGIVTVLYIGMTLDQIDMAAVAEVPSGSTQQVIGALCLNKTFSLPPQFCLMQTANNPGEAMQAEGIEERIDAFSSRMLSSLRKES